MCSQVNDYDGTGAAVNFERVSSFMDMVLSPYLSCIQYINKLSYKDCKWIK